MFVVESNKWLGGEIDPLLPACPKLEVCVQPITVDMADEAAAARMDFILTLARGEDGDLLPVSNLDYKRAFRAEAMCLIKRGIVAWRGVVDDQKVDLPVTPAIVESVINHPEIFAALDLRYAAPFMMRSAEKNVSAPSPSTISETDGTAGAMKDAPETAAAPNAPTTPNAPEPPKAEASGD